ncbi:MAG: hypothetical protein PHE68_02705 [Candidatus Peribacteraceae bacterium]|nr:hypothetical protein [Candidatus Peribacteraceae bacterium]MDD5075322.1 hypothetical protein [Candidatus Peribacteraceae bacterium]
MPSLFIAIGSWVLLIVILEWFMWVLFRRKFTEISLPTAFSDRTIFHLFTIGRMRIFALLHTLLLIAVIVVSHLLLWP